MNKLIATAALLVALAAMTAPAYALTAAQAKNIKQTVLSVPVPEMPAKAADIVSASTKKDREDVAVTVVRAVISKHRAAAPVIVAAISKVAPEVSAAVAKVATQEAPEQKSQILAAATTAAPEQANLISTVTSSAATPVGSTLVGSESSSVARESAVRASGTAVAVRDSADPSEGTIVVIPGPVKYQNPPPPQPVPQAPVAKTGPRVR